MPSSKTVEQAIPVGCLFASRAPTHGPPARRAQGDLDPRVGNNGSATISIGAKSVHGVLAAGAVDDGRVALVGRTSLVRHRRRAERNSHRRPRASRGIPRRAGRQGGNRRDEVLGLRAGSAAAFAGRRVVRSVPGGSSRGRVADLPGHADADQLVAPVACSYERPPRDRGKGPR
jgi:hypothetical protein